MSDLEQRLAGVLVDVAEDAPTAVGLADAARRRRRVRRQRRLALGGAAVAAAVIAGAVAVGVGGGPDRASDPVDRPSPAPSPGVGSDWQTVEVDGGGSLMSLPPDWSPHECGSPGDTQTVHAPADSDPCVDSVGAVFLPAGIRGEQEQGALVSGDGGWLGYVTAGQWEVRVFHEDRALVRRILATARVAGQPEVDGSTWVTFERDGLGYEIPAWWGLGQDADLSPYSVCLLAPGSPKLDEEMPGTGFVLSAELSSGDVLRVAAPTEAVASLVLAAVDDVTEVRSSVDCAPEDFAVGLLPPETEGDGGSAPEPESIPVLKTVEVLGITLDVPSTWSVTEDCGGEVQIGPGRACDDGMEEGTVRFYVDALLDPAMSSGELIESADRTLWAGYVLRGRYAVFVSHSSRQTVETMLERVR